jgi:hypothetical protein
LQTRQTRKNGGVLAQFYLGGFLEGGDPNSKGYAAVVIFAILIGLIVWSYFNSSPCDPF